MKTAEELKAAFAVYYSEMDRCEKAGAYWALLHLALVLPDICASLEGPTRFRRDMRLGSKAMSHSLRLRS